jgi:hypothetical protein
MSWDSLGVHTKNGCIFAFAVEAGSD